MVDCGCPGPVGPMGPTGPTGATGPAGPTGAAGVDTVESYVDLGDHAGPVTINYAAGRWQRIRLTGNIIITVVGMPDPPVVSTLFLLLEQDGAVARTVSWPVGVKWPQGGTPATSAGTGVKDLIQLISIGGIIYGMVGGWGFLP